MTLSLGACWTRCLFLWDQYYSEPGAVVYFSLESSGMVFSSFQTAAVYDDGSVSVLGSWLYERARRKSPDGEVG